MPAARKPVTKKVATKKAAASRTVTRKKGAKADRTTAAAGWWAGPRAR